jgi:hypothetical protein
VCNRLRNLQVAVLGRSLNTPGSGFLCGPLRLLSGLCVISGRRTAASQSLPNRSDTPRLHRMTPIAVYNLTQLKSADFNPNFDAKARSTNTNTIRIKDSAEPNG